MASTIQPYADAKNRVVAMTNYGGLGMGDALMAQMQSTALAKQRAQMAATAGTDKASLGPMTLSALMQGSFWS